MKPWLAALAVPVLLAVFSEAPQQDPASRPSPPKPRAEDVATPEAAVAALYDVISGPAGAKRDWDRFRSLFRPDARMAALRPAKDGVSATVDMTPEQYVARSGAWLEKNGFFERSVADKVEIFGDLAHVWSTYESRKTAEDKAPFARGINSIQLLKVGGAWAVQSIAWGEERADLPIPAKYLPVK